MERDSARSGRSTTTLESENIENILENNFLKPNTTNRLEIDLPSARLKYNELCITLDLEEKKILDLEERRKDLQKEMERLQQEIEYEKFQFREAIDIEIENRYQPEEDCENQPGIDIFSIDRTAVQNQLNDFRQHLRKSREDNDFCEDDQDIKRFKANLINYKKGLDTPEIDKIIQDTRKEAGKLLHKHLKLVDEQCSEKIKQFESITKKQDNFSDHENSNREI